MTGGGRSCNVTRRSHTWRHVANARARPPALACTRVVARDRDAQACGKSLFEVPKFAVNRDLTLTFVASRHGARPSEIYIYISFFRRKSREGESPIALGSKPLQAERQRRKTGLQRAGGRGVDRRERWVARRDEGEERGNCLPSVYIARSGWYRGNTARRHRNRSPGDSRIILQRRDLLMYLAYMFPGCVELLRGIEFRYGEDGPKPSELLLGHFGSPSLSCSLLRILFNGGAFSVCFPFFPFLNSLTVAGW